MYILELKNALFCPGDHNPSSQDKRSRIRPPNRIKMQTNQWIQCHFSNALSSPMDHHTTVTPQHKEMVSCLPSPQLLLELGLNRAVTPNSLKLTGRSSPLYRTTAKQHGHPGTRGPHNHRAGRASPPAAAHPPQVITISFKSPEGPRQQPASGPRDTNRTLAFPRTH